MKSKTNHFSGVMLSAAVWALALVPASQAAEPMPQPQYVFRAEVSRVVAGDLVEMNIDLGFGVWVHGQTLYLTGVKAPDMVESKEEALKWKARLTELLKQRAEIIIQTSKDKQAKPPRYLAVIWADGENINEAMKAGGN